jgi:hypothetical protein
VLGQVRGGALRPIAVRTEHRLADFPQGVGGARHRPAGRHAADQRDHGDPGMAGERGARLLAAGHDVEHAGRQDAVDQLGEA